MSTLTDSFANSPSEIANTLKTFLQAKRELTEVHIPQALEYYKDQREYNWENYSRNLQGDYNDAILQTQRRITSLLINIKEVTLLRDNGVNYKDSIAKALELIEKTALCKAVEHKSQANVLDMTLMFFLYNCYIYKTQDNRLLDHLSAQLDMFPQMLASEEELAASAKLLAVEIDEMLGQAIEELNSDLKFLIAELVSCKNDLAELTKELADTIKSENARAEELASRLAMLENFKLWLSYVEKDYKYVFDKYPDGFKYILCARVKRAAAFSHYSSKWPEKNDSRPKRR